MKDEKGHGSNGRGGFSGAISHVARIMQAHNIQGGPFKVQSLDTSLVGKPWATAKTFKNRTVAERVAQGMRSDGGYTRVK